MDLISIIIPVFNAEQYLERCINSVINQTYKNLQIILVDDGSSDNSGVLCDKMAGMDSRIEVIHKENQGVAKARNDGLNMVKGDFIGFIDADDYAETDMFEKLYSAICNNNADASVCGYFEEYSDAPTKIFSSGEDCVMDVNEAYSDYLKMGGKMGSGTWNKLFRATAIGDNRYKSYVIGEDVEFLCRVLNNCSKVALISYAGYHYIHAEDSATAKKFRVKNLDIINASRDITAFIDDNRPELSDNAYAFQASWVVATLQVMYRDKDVNTEACIEGRKVIRKCIEDNLPKYKNNSKMYWIDKLFIRFFMMGIFGPMNELYKIYLKIRRR